MTRRVVFDASFLAALMDPTTSVRVVAGVTEHEIRERLAYLIERLDAEGSDVVIPTPALAELLTVAQRDPSVALETLNGQARFRILPFDQRAAAECGIRIREALHGRRGGADQKQRAAIKFDAMILAIALVERATVIYADDDGLRRQAKAAGLDAFGFGELPARPEPPQAELLPKPIPSGLRPRTPTGGRKPPT